MSTQHLSTIRQTLRNVLSEIAVQTACDVESLLQKLTLRPPKNPSWGDLCTNVVLLICADEKEAHDKYGPEFTTQFEKLDFIQSATVSDNGYINLKINSDYWASQLFDICRDGVGYGMGDRVPAIDTFVALKPANTDDLVSLRQRWNVEALSNLARQVGTDVTEGEWQAGEQRGFSLKGALAKCGEQKLKLALLSSGPDFAVKFSPIMATEQSYDNPAFSFLYAMSRIDALLVQFSEDEKEEDGALLLEGHEDIKLTLRLEVELSKLLCHSPIYVRKALEEGDMNYLTSFLQSVTLLFFRLYRHERLQSSDYLGQEGHKNARKLLLKAVNTQIGNSLKLMGIDRAKEFI